MADNSESSSSVLEQALKYCQQYVKPQVIFCSWPVSSVHMLLIVVPYSKSNLKYIPNERSRNQNFYSKAFLWIVCPSLKPTFCSKWEVSVNVGLGEGQVSSVQETYDDSLSWSQGSVESNLVWNHKSY